MERLRIGLIGYGYWGPNLLRNFGTCPLTEPVAVCDASPVRRASSAGFDSCNDAMAAVKALNRLQAVRGANCSCRGSFHSRTT